MILSSRPLAGCLLMKHAANHYSYGKCVGSTELFSFEDDCRRAGFTSPARHRGDGGASRETDLIFSTLRARRESHGAKARARLATDGSPVDSPSSEPSGAEICRASPSRKRPAGRKKHDFTLFYFVCRSCTGIETYSVPGIRVHFYLCSSFCAVFPEFQTERSHLTEYTSMWT